MTGYGSMPELWEAIKEKFPEDHNIYRFCERGKIIHTIDISDSWYRNIGTLEGLRHRLTKRFSYWYDRGNKDFHPNLRYFAGCDMMLFRMPEMEIKHHSVKAFYEYIGYEKNNRSVKQLDKILYKHWRSNE